MITKTNICFASLLFSANLLLTACTENRQPIPGPAVQVKGAVTEGPVQEKVPVTDSTDQSLDEKPPLTRITAPAYTVDIYKAISFLPKEDLSGPMKLKKGHQYVVLELAVQNTSKEKEVDFGQVLRTAKAKDEQGKEYFMNAMAIAAYTHNNPDSHHQAQYNALSDKLKPGDYYRTVAFGLQVPQRVKKMVLRMKEAGDLLDEGKWNEAAFEIE